MKKKWTEQKQARSRANEEFTKLTANQQICRESKFIAINRADFKPRIYPRICQYCGFTTKGVCNTKRHVNACHEMTDWYRCECCDFASLDIDVVKRHLKLLHSKNITRERLESCLIKDEEVIDCLRSKKIQRKKSRKDSSILLPEQLSSEPKYLPVDKADFKPRINRLICQYCGFSRKNVGHVNDHVNVRHEMITWYQCKKCNYANLSSHQFRKHLQIEHLEKNITKVKLKGCITKNPKEIDQLKKLQIKEMNNPEKQTRFKSGIVEKIKQMTSSDVFKFKPRKLRKNDSDNSKSDPRRTAFNLSDKEQEIPTDLSENEDYFRSESDDEPDVDVNPPMKLKALSIVLERLKTPIIKENSVSSNKKVLSWSTKGIKKEDEPSETDDRFMVAWATKDIKKEEEPSETDDKFMVAWATKGIKKEEDLSETDDRFMVAWATKDTKKEEKPSETDDKFMVAWATKDIQKEEEPSETDDKFMVTWATKDTKKEEEPLETDDKFMVAWATKDIKKEEEPSETDDKFMVAWATKDIKKEEELSETDDRFMVAWATRDIKKEEEPSETDDRLMVENEQRFPELTR